MAFAPFDFTEMSEQRWTRTHRLPRTEHESHLTGTNVSALTRHLPFLVASLNVTSHSTVHSLALAGVPPPPGHHRGTDGLSCERITHSIFSVFCDVCFISGVQAKQQRLKGLVALGQNH